MILILNRTSILLLKNIKDGINDKKNLMNTLKIKNWQFNYIVQELMKKDYIEKRDSKFYLKNNSKTILFRDVANKYDIIKLLQDSNESLITSLIEPLTIMELQKQTNLSEATIYRSLSDLSPLEY